MPVYRENMKNGFTLVELIIVVSILGILAAIVIPAFSDNSQQAKEAAAKDILRILRNAVEIYAAQHNGVPPGYQDDDTSNVPDKLFFTVQMIANKQYLSEPPENPITGAITIKVITGSNPLPAPDEPEMYGWLYQPETKTFKLNAAGQDGSGTDYFDY